MTYWFITIGFVIVAALALWLIITTLTGRGEELPPPPRGFVVPPAEGDDSTSGTLSDGPAYPLSRSQLATARFPLSPRGYRPSDVDRYIEHVLATVDHLEARLAEYERTTR